MRKSWNRCFSAVFLRKNVHKALLQNCGEMWKLLSAVFSVLNRLIIVELKLMKSGKFCGTAIFSSDFFTIRCKMLFWKVWNNLHGYKVNMLKFLLKTQFVTFTVIQHNFKHTVENYVELHFLVFIRDYALLLSRIFFIISETSPFRFESFWIPSATLLIE